MSEYKKVQFKYPDTKDIISQDAVTKTSPEDLKSSCASAEICPTKTDDSSSKPRNVTTTAWERFQNLEKQADIVSRRSREKRIKHLQKTVIDKVQNELTSDEDRDILREHDVKFGPPIHPAGSREVTPLNTSNPGCSGSMDRKSSSDRTWVEIKQYLDVNSHLQARDRSSLAPKSGLEKEIETAVREGDVKQAEELSDRLSTRDFGVKIAGAVAARDFMKRKKEEAEQGQQKNKKKKLPWGWAGLMDGRYDDVTLTRLVREDDAMDHVRQNVLGADVLLIDEISMLSKKDFEQLDLVCRTILNAYRNFGGLQVVASGDFYQLPPVGNTLYGDSAKFCFESEIWKSFFVHRINFETVVRQNEPELMRAVSETARGAVSNETDIFLKTLERDMYNQNPIHLFARNFDANIFNHEQLTKLNTDGKSYEATINSGSDKHLKRILAPKFLHVKISCPVILLRNLGGKLMNGLRGVVTGFTDNDITVHFEIINETHTIRRYLFTVYQPSFNGVGGIIAERQQFPLCLAYGLTIHKSQGMTLKSVYIHCKGIFESGQFSVALGRATDTSGIQLINYRKSLCLQPKAAVSNFYRTTHSDFEDSLKCCKKSPNVCIPDSELTIQHYDSDDSDFNEAEIEVLENLVDSDEDSSTSVEDIVLPDYVSLDLIKLSVTVKTPLTEKQKQINDICSSVLDIRLKKFMHKNYNHLETILPLSETPTTPKLWTEILSKYHRYISSTQYKETLQLLYGECSVSDEQVYVGTQFIYKLLNLMVHSLASEISRKPDETKTQPISEAGKAKLRYVAGMCVSKARQHFCGIIENQLGSEKKGAPEKVKSNLEKVSLVRSLQAEIDEIDSTDKTFSEIEQRQNVRKGLTYINDQCFQFFLNVDGKIRGILNADTLRYEKENLFETAKNVLLKDEDLQILWTELSIGVTSDVSYSVYENIISRFLMVSQKQFLKDMKDMLSLKKKKAHREEIKKSQGKRKVEISLSYKDIMEDKSENKISSHLKLKCNSIADEQFLEDPAFTKVQLLKLCEAYNVQCSKTCKKAEVSNLLVQGILKVGAMPNSEALDSSAPGPVASSSKRQRRKTVPSKGKGKGKGQSNRKEKKTYCGMCSKEYKDNEDWVECGFCNEWFDRTCAGLADDSEWSRILDDDVDWECHNCKA